MRYLKWFLISLYVPQANNLVKYASKNGTHGNQWLPLQIQLNTAGSQSIVIEGVRGSNYLGDIAIDDIHVISGSCKSQGKYVKVLDMI